MAASAARIAANRKNSEKSTGPRTIRGKNRSRANSLQHGLTARVLRTLEEVEAIGEATDRPIGKPGSSPLDRGWIVGEIELLSIRVERAGLMELKLRERAALRASICWDLDRRSEAEAIGSKIRKKPAEIASALEKTPQGCRWMIERWGMLARAADRDGDWSPMARELAFDLFGTPHELRGGPIAEQIDTFGQVTEPGKNLAEFARRNVDRLYDIQEKLAQTDAFDRSTAQAGLAEDLGAAGARLIRYEADLQRRLKWYHDLLDRMPDLEPTDNPEVPPAVPEPAVPGPEPEVEAAPRESTPAPPTPPPSRKDRRALRVEQRRLAAERKLARRLE